MPKHWLSILAAGVLIAGNSILASPQLLEKHCSKCHNEEKHKGDFVLTQLGSMPASDNFELWSTSLDYLSSGEMPPPENSSISDEDRTLLIKFFKDGVQSHSVTADAAHQPRPRRLNNREFANTVSHALLIEHAGSHHPTANLLGDTLQNGFDTSGEALGMSEFHLDEYLTSVRGILDAVILSPTRPPTQDYQISTDRLRMTSLSQRRRAERCNRTPTSIDFLDIRLRVYFENFKVVPHSGRYQLKIRATGIDRAHYDASETGIYDDDPIRLRVHLGNQIRDFDLPDNEVLEIELDEWLAEGTRIELSYPTDGLRLRGNGNFKFQYAIAHDHLKKHDPERYQNVINREIPRAPARTAKNPGHWSHWTDEWEGPRPRIFNAEIKGPIYEAWPPKRQTALLGESPRVSDAARILQPIAERAWRRDVSRDELQPIVQLVRSQAEKLGTVQALKEGIVAILISPAFLMLHSPDLSVAERFAEKWSYFLKSSPPKVSFRKQVASGQFEEFHQVRDEVYRLFRQAEVEAFLDAFPRAWLELNRINFMAPDPDHFPLYDRKRLSEDMVAEALHFFRHVIANNLPLSEFLEADYSFVNADLAKVYGLSDVPADSKLRRYQFTDGRRGGLLGMGAFLTLTADSLTTSPIHRAVYVMENLLGIHPSPPPPNVEIQEPDVRQARTIKEILSQHTADSNCATCHRGIDPYGYAFENFDPIGAWRDHYKRPGTTAPSRAARQRHKRNNLERIAQGLAVLPAPWEGKTMAIDSSARFRNGDAYQGIREYRELMQSDVNRRRFVRSFISKLLTYANGDADHSTALVNAILKRSEAHDFRILDTIAAVIHSPSFRN